MPSSLFGLLRLMITPLVASCLHAPLAWSPDGQWLAYTTIEGAESARDPSDWLFDTSEPPRGSISPKESEGGGLVPGGRRYRIWVAQRGSPTSLLIEESRSPLSAPTWNPDGRSLFYCRFVQQSNEANQATLRGRFEMVAQDALDRKRVVSALYDVELDRGQVESFPQLRAAWSPDGQYLAVPRPGRPASILILRADNGRVLKTLEQAVLPAWAPDGSRLAFLGPGPRPGEGNSIQVAGLDFGPSRRLADVNQAMDVLAWGNDAHSLFAVIPRSKPRGRELELVRVAPELGAVIPLLTLSTLPLQNASTNQLLTLGVEDGRSSTLRGVSVSLDRDQEHCVFSTDILGQTPSLAWCNVRNPVIYKRFHPLDTSLRIGALALAPDGQTLAFRIEGPDGSSPVAFCELGSEVLSLVAPDASSRREWLDTLVTTARNLLKAALPSTPNGGPRLARPTPLPVPGELSPHHAVASRLRRIGKVGKSLIEQAQGQSNVAESNLSWDEGRLFFDYLREDYAAAETSLEIVASKTASPDHRLRLLGVRAQILAAQGQNDRARAVVEYLQPIAGEVTRQVEETPSGLVFSPAGVPGHDWIHYLAQRLSGSIKSGASTSESAPQVEPDSIDIRLQNAIEGRGARPFQGRALPFAPPDQNPPRFNPGRMGIPFRPDQTPRFFRPPAPPRPFQPGIQRIPRFSPPLGGR